jgi:hypothetical protein
LQLDILEFKCCFEKNLLYKITAPKTKGREKVGRKEGQGKIKEKASNTKST